MIRIRTVVSCALLAALAVPASLAADSKIVTVYRDPDAKPPAFTKIAVAVLSQDADLRRRAEGGLARRIRNSTAASTLLPDGEVKDAAAAKARLTGAGFDGAILVRPLPLETEETIEESRLYAFEHTSITNYWESTWRTVYLPGYVNIEKIVTVEVAVYSVAGDKLLWVGRMKSTGPKSLRVFLDELVKVGAAELKKQKLI